MPAAIPESIKSRVITQWLHGPSRDAIARNNKISTGAVSNIINSRDLVLEQKRKATEEIKSYFEMQSKN
jgi:hypothetical protein